MSKELRRMFDYNYNVITKPLPEEINQEVLKSLIHYDDDTGIYTWKVSPCSRIKIGDRAGGVGNTISIGGTSYTKTNLIWLYMYGVYPKGKVVHLNSNKQDFRRIKLKELKSNEYVVTSKYNTVVIVVKSSPIPKKAKAEEVVVEPIILEKPKGFVNKLKFLL